MHLNDTFDLLSCDIVKECNVIFLFDAGLYCFSLFWLEWSFTNFKKIRMSTDQIVMF